MAGSGSCEEVSDLRAELCAVSEEERAQEGAGRGVRVLLERLKPGCASVMERAQSSSEERWRTEPDQAV